MAFIWPILAIPTSLPAGYRWGATRTTGSTPHARSGVDLGRYGDTVRAIDTGKVAFAGQSSGLGGLMVYINHAGGWQSRYMHLMPSSLKVSTGSSVLRGANLGKIGCSGINNRCTPGGDVAGSHLHFEMLKNCKTVSCNPDRGEGTRVDPEVALRDSSGPRLFLLAAAATAAYLVVKAFSKG